MGAITIFIIKIYTFKCYHSFNYWVWSFDNSAQQDTSRKISQTSYSVKPGKKHNSFSYHQRTI